MVKHIPIPIKDVGGSKWGDLSVFGHAHEIVCEVARLKDEKFSFGGNHRVRLYALKKNVHFRVPTEFDISEVEPLKPVRKNQRR